MKIWDKLNIYLLEEIIIKIKKIMKSYLQHKCASEMS